MKRISIFAVGLLMALSAGMSLAEQIAWRRQVLADIPAGTDLHAMAQANAGGVPDAAVIALVSFSIDEDNNRYRLEHFDARTGVRAWSTSLPLACRHWDTRGVLAAWPNGDAVVAVAAGGDSGRVSTCLLRVRGSDGAVLWSRSEQFEDGSLRVNALAIDNEGHVLAGGLKGRAAMIERLDGDTGEPLWRREIPAPEDVAMDTIFLGAGATHVVAGVVSNRTSGLPGFQYIGLSLERGEDAWSNEACSRIRYNRLSRHAPATRMLGDGSFVHALECRETATSSVRIGRHDAGTGTVRWQRELPGSTQNAAVIAQNGDIVMGGPLALDTGAAGIARFAADSGATRWSANITFPALGYFLAVTPDRVHVLESVPDTFTNYPLEASLASYDGASGAFSARMAFPLPGYDMLFYSQQDVLGMADGDVLAYGMHAENHASGGSLRRVRLDPTAGQIVSSVSEPVATARPFVPPLYESPGLASMVASDDGEPGIVIMGSGRDEYYGYPRAVKLSRRDGRVLWKTDFDPQVKGALSDVATDAEGDVVVSGYVRTSPSIVAAKLDGATGASLWTVSDDRIASSIATDAAGDAALSLVWRDEGTVNALVKLARADGTRIWETPIPDGYHDQTVAVDHNGDFIVTGTYRTGSVANQVVKIRGADGALLWTARGAAFANGELLRALPATDGEVIVNSDGRVVKLDASSGAILWQRELPLWIRSQHLASDGGIVLGGAGSFDESSGAAVAHLRATDGVVQWMKYVSTTLGPSLSSQRVTALSSAGEHSLLVSGGDGSRRYFAAQLMRADGNIEWEVADAMPVPSSLNMLRGDEFYPVGITRMLDGSIFFGGQFVPYPATWTLYKVTGPHVDDIFASGFE